MKHQTVKKQFVAIDIHSFIDVITNSSTELFVCMDNKVVENVKEILEYSGIFGWKEPFVFKLDEFKKNKENYNSDYHMLDGWFYDDTDPDLKDNIRKEFINSEPWCDNYLERQQSSNMEWRKKLNSEFRETPYSKRDPIIDRVFEEIKAGKISKPYWWVEPEKYEHGDPISLLEDKVIILGDGDNSIPWGDVERIENMFHARRYHLG